MEISGFPGPPKEWALRKKAIILPPLAPFPGPG